MDEIYRTDEISKVRAVYAYYNCICPNIMVLMITYWCMIIGTYDVGLKITL